MAYSYSQNDVVKVKHLQAAASRSQTEITNLAGLGVGAIEDLVLQASIIVPTTAWTTNSDSTTLAEGYSYKADVSVTGLIESANVSIAFSAASLSAAYEAGVCPTVLVSNGSIRFYSASVPESNLTGTVNATQVAED